MLSVASGVPLVVDISGRGISEVSQVPGGGTEMAALMADNNKLISLTGIHTFTSLVQLSVCSNNLVDISAVASLTSLVTLNLQNNSITVIEGLQCLTQLEWLGLAGNSIKVMAGLTANTKLTHLDLSDNCVTELGNISMLRRLKTLLLHGNAVKLLKSVPHCLPPSLSTLSLAENHVQDLNEISFLSTLPMLREVSVMGNPCVSLTHHSMLFDYRPYVVYWCPELSTLDGTPISAEEKLRSVSLFRSNHTYPFQLGQHQSLVQYLMTACPLPILQNQWCVGGSENSKSAVSLDSSTSSLLSQALSLQNPVQKAEVMQKLRVLQVLEQMISEQENLLNTQQKQQQQQQREQQPSFYHTLEGSADGEGAVREQQPSLYHTLEGSADGEMHSPSQQPQYSSPGGGVVSREPDNSLADTTLTAADIETVDGGTIPPQPSLPFDVIDGSSYGMWRGPELVRVAWAEGATNPHEYPTTVLPSGDVKVGGSEECEMGEMGGHVGEAGGQKEMGSLNCKQEQNLIEPASVTSSSHCSLQSSEDSLTPVPPPDTTPAETGTRKPENEESEKENEIVSKRDTAVTVELTNARATLTLSGEHHTSDRETSHSALADTESTTTGELQNSQASSVSSLAPTTLSLAAPATSSVPAVNSWEMMRREFSDIPLETSHDTVVAVTPGLVTAEKSTDNTLCSHNMATLESSVHQPEVMDAENEQELEGKDSLSVEMDTESTVVVGAGSNGDDVVQEKTAEGAELEVKYSSSVDPPLFFTAEESNTSLADQTSAGVLESDSQSLPVPENGIKTGEWDSSLSASSSRLGERKEKEELNKESDVCEIVSRNMTTHNEGFGETHSLTPSVPITEVTEGDESARQWQSEEVRRHCAAVVVQSWVRGELSRRQVREFRTRHQAAITIQSSWRGYRSRQRDPVVVSARRELSRKKMEAYVATMYFQLKGCREEMAHQAQVLQLQEETITSLIQEVKTLRAWKREVEAGMKNTADSTVQRYQGELKAKKENQDDSESLQAVCRDLKQQVSELEKRVELLQKDAVWNTKTPMSQVPSLGAPGKVVMTKHSSDTILLQWTPPDVADRLSPILGYRVYVNSIEEGMVGPTKTRAYIEGLDTSSTYRISVRAVYNSGESQDSNTLLLAAVGQRSGEGLMKDSTHKEILSLPRSSEPPQPSEMPELVEQTSALSKSESCSTLPTVSVDISTSNEPSSMSLNLPTPSDQTSSGGDQIFPFVGEIGNSVDQPGATIFHTTITSVDLADCSGEQSSASTHQTDTNIVQAKSVSVDETSVDVVSEKELPASPMRRKFASKHLPALAVPLDNLKQSPKQEMECELSTRHVSFGPHTNTVHAEKNEFSVPHLQPTTETAPHEPDHPKQRDDRKKLHSAEKPHANGGLCFAGEDVASSVRDEAKEIPTVDQLCVQTQPSLTSVNDKGVLQTDTPPLAIGPHSPSINSAGVRDVTHNLEPAISPVTTEVRRQRASSPTGRRTHRLAANFETNLSHANFGVNTGMPRASQPPKSHAPRHLHQLHATQSPSCQLSLLQSSTPPSIFPTLHPPPKQCNFVVQTPISPPREQHSTKITFSGEEPTRTAKEQPLITDCQKVERGMLHTGILGQSVQGPLATISDTTHLSASGPQPTTQPGPDNHSTRFLPQPGEGDTECLVGSPPANSGLLSPTPLSASETTKS